jgi:hypothetical protein
LNRGAGLLAAIVVAAVILRGILVFHGGQGYWPDELRYERSRAAVAALARGEWSEAERSLDHPDHALFGVLGLLPAAAERALGRPSAKIPALFFAAFSVASLLLLALLVRRLGESRRAATLAAALLALSATHLYYSRHLLPYDAAMAMGLAAVLVGVGRFDRPLTSVACGILAAAAVLTYGGFWLLGGFAVLVHVASGPRTLRDVSGRAAAAGFGFALPFAALIAGDAALGGDLARRWFAFSRTVSQGDYGEGWSLPLAYLWHAEHLIALLWAAAVVWAAVRIARGDRRAALLVGVAGIAVVYAGLVGSSVALRKTVVYGRLARQLVPFACVLTALMLDRLWSVRRAAAQALLAAAAVQAALNFRAPLTQVFPAEFRRLAAGVPSPPGRERRLLYAEHIYPVPAPPPPGCEGAELLSRPHPLQYRPYQYEGYTPPERAALRGVDIRMRLILCGPPGPSGPR